MEFSGPIITDQAHLEAARHRIETARTPLGRLLGRLSTEYYSILIMEDIEELECAADLAGLSSQTVNPQA